MLSNLYSTYMMMRRIYNNTWHAIQLSLAELRRKKYDFHINRGVGEYIVYLI
jgi:hypothetical protein